MKTQNLTDSGLSIYDQEIKQYIADQIDLLYQMIYSGNTLKQITDKSGILLTTNDGKSILATNKFY